jgi:translation initiation factor IF-3
LLQRLAEDVAELGFVESSPKQDGRNMVMVLGPMRKKADVMAEQRAERESRKHDDDEAARPTARPTEGTQDHSDAETSNSA